jgi:hypothetical protein
MMELAVRSTDPMWIEALVKNPSPTCNVRIGSGRSIFDQCKGLVLEMASTTHLPDGRTVSSQMAIRNTNVNKYNTPGAVQ